MGVIVLAVVCAPASRAAAEAEADSRSEADLMYDALKQWRGEPPGSATIDRVLAQSKKEADRNRKMTREKIASLFWRDPFSDDPKKLIPVRAEDRDLFAAHQETSRARAETAAARAEAAVARADAARARADMARAEAIAARAEAIAARRECAAASGPYAEHRTRVHSTGSSGRHRAQRAQALNGPIARGDRRYSAPAMVVEATVPSNKPPAAPGASGWHSNDPRGIIVVPIEAPSQPEKKSAPAR